LAQSGPQLQSFDFWRTLEAYNAGVRLPPRPGHEYFIKELGPFIAEKVCMAQNCHGCGSLVDENEYAFWFPREICFSHLHFCQPCVAYILYHLEAPGVVCLVSVDAFINCRTS
jgi:hypothetical protein